MPHPDATRLRADIARSRATTMETFGYKTSLDDVDPRFRALCQASLAVVDRLEALAKYL